jgi:hypothetical protein
MASLKTRFEEMIHMTWGAFVDLEQDKGASVDDGVLCSLIRICADTDDIAAIKLAFDRVDGLLTTPIEVKVPKFYNRYVNAKEIEPGATPDEKGKYERVGYGYDIVELWNVKNRVANNQQSNPKANTEITTYHSAVNTGATSAENTLIWIQMDINISKSMVSGTPNTGLSWLEHWDENLQRAKVYITKMDKNSTIVLKTLSYGSELYDTVKELEILSAPIVVSRTAPPSASGDKASDYDPATAKLRETLIEMRGMPQDVIRVVRLYKKHIDDGKNEKHDPMVKSVIVANLLRNVKRGRYRAIELVFDQIDGKLTRTITLLGGDDVYVDDYNTVVAPAGAIKDEDGYYIAENSIMTTAWLRGFANSQKGLEIVAQGLEDEH